MQQSLFSDPLSRPLAERMRPADISEIAGQEELLGDGAPLRRMIDSGKLSSFILWGPPGCGKTTVGLALAKALGRPYTPCRQGGKGGVFGTLGQHADFATSFWLPCWGGQGRTLS